MNKIKLVAGIIIIGLILIVGASLLIFNNNGITGRAIYEIKEVDLAINTLPNSALIHIAQEKGYFSEQGLKVNYHAFPTGKLALDALIGGGADIATTADVPFTLAGLADQPISVVATIEYSTDNIQVVARKDSGIEKPKDLEGKKIATTNGGGPLFFASKFYEKYGIKNVKQVSLNPSDMAAALIKGDIDAFIVFEPSPSIAKKEMGEDRLTVFAPNDLYGETWNIVVMQKYEEENKATIQKFLAALIKAEKFYNEYPNESLDIVSKYSGTDIDLLKDILAKQEIGVVLINLLINLAQEEAEWAVETGISSSTNIPDYRNIVNDEYLRELKPGAVQI